MLNWRWKYFKPEELLSTSGLYQYVRKHNLMLQEYALDGLVEFREKINVPLICNDSVNKRRGWRSVEENIIVGGARYSRHVQGIAFDLTAKGITNDELFELATSFDFGCVIKYPTFCHCDFRSIVKNKIHLIK